MLHILNDGVPGEIVKAIAIMYDNPSCFVQSTDGLTKEFLTTTGILQGDTLAPFLLVIVVDYILRQCLDIIHDKGLTIKQKPGSNQGAIKVSTSPISTTRMISLSRLTNCVIRKTC
ncbi:hypothetical protein NHX12_002637 [Muraenolepis orangiensis]|uniref:Reverse transcriptase domain-containing protein n=1 Tax=Muraenolepis orangiensis TaxID=630683 RepID=A0A9Q0DXK8_9TELE|nr:hypothetical protein NHX12_002474 [Muraenolepis orangiensis]KAJ3596228.1 hypothetical protein NHX12_002637 [Muraenolepis orangiensis]